MVKGSQQIQPAKILAVAMAIFALLAVWSHWPYGTYTILRFAICATSVYLAVRSYQAGQRTWAWINGITAAFFNPFFPLHLQRGQWKILDFGAAFVFTLWAWKVRLAESEQQHAVQPPSMPNTTDSGQPTNELTVPSGSVTGEKNKSACLRRRTCRRRPNCRDPRR